VFGLPRELEESAPSRFANAVGFVALPVATMAAYTRAQDGSPGDRASW
jgi:hypothetical protein